MKLADKIKIGKRWIGEGEPCFIIAETGINHNGDVKIAKEMIDAAKAAKADCVKFQTFKAKEFIADPRLTHTYKSQGKKVVEPVIKMFQRHEFSPKEWKEIINYCKKKGVIFATSAQNPSDLDFILSLVDMPFIKIGSDDLTTGYLIEYYAKKKKPVIISTGMADFKEINEAVRTILKTGNNKLIIFHCVSLYPTSPEEANLNRMDSIKKVFGGIVGFSDHTTGILASLAAVARGAKLIEKHFTLSKDMPGPDHWFSIDPEELKELVSGIRYIEKTMAGKNLGPAKRELAIRKPSRRSIVAALGIKKGEKITDKLIEYKKPGTGIPPKLRNFIIGKIAKRNIKEGGLITFKNIK